MTCKSALTRIDQDRYSLDPDVKQHLAELISSCEEWLMERILTYAKSLGYARYTSTLKEAWRLSISGLSSSLMDLLAKDAADLELGPDDDFVNDPAASFGVFEAKRHRERGINLGMFLGLMKYYREAYKDLVRSADADGGFKEYGLRVVERFFDRVEIGFCVEWAASTQGDITNELQSTNRRMTNEKNKYLTTFESLPDAVLILDTDNRIDAMNHPAARLFEPSSIPGDQYYTITTPAADRPSDKYLGKPVEMLLPWIVDELTAFTRFNAKEQSTEKKIDTSQGGKNFNIRFSRMLDVSGKFQGVIIILHDITDRNKAKNALQKTTQDLKDTIKGLKQANRKILDQQKSLIEEERLKVLLQMAGATAHELNQPLMALLGNIELMSLEKNDLDKVISRAQKIENAGKRIANIVKKIQTIRHYEVKSYAGDSKILNLDQKINILVVDNSDEDYARIQQTLEYQPQIMLTRAREIAEALAVLNAKNMDLIFLDYVLPSGNGLDFMSRLQEKEIDTPVIFITAEGDEMLASQAINCGAYDYLPKANISEQALQRVINNAMEKFRLKKEVEMTLEKMAEMSTRDELTGLYNRRYFKEVFERETASSQRYSTELVLCMMDLDQFKRVNDTYGHPAGDKVLKEVAFLLKKTVRKSDIACRYGGEEFAVILPNTDIEHARVFCERYRREVENHIIKYNDVKLSVTLSIGVARFLKDSKNMADDLLKNADQALYLAKTGGRNRVVLGERDVTGQVRST